MTTDLVARLLAFPGGAGAEKLCREAADRIAELERRNHSLWMQLEYATGEIRSAGLRGDEWSSEVMEKLRKMESENPS
jgi:hypothetical protein